MNPAEPRLFPRPPGRLAGRVVGFLGLLLLLGAGWPGRAPASPERDTLERIAAEHYDAPFRERAGAYHRVRLTATLIQMGLTLFAAIWLLTTPLGAWGARALGSAGGHAWLARIAVLFWTYLGFTLLRAPFSVFRYLLARQYDLRHDPWTAFLLDWLKAVGIGAVLVIVVGSVVLALFAAWPRWWWVVATGVVSLFAVGYVTLAPLVIDPLFNRFTPLDDPALEQRLLALAEAGGVPAQEILVADASRRTRAVNAYFTGFGTTRRIVLYDTLIDRFDDDEVAMVLAHEVGHWKHNHIVKGLVLGLGATALGLLLAHLLLGGAADRGWRGLAGRGDPGVAIAAYAFYILMSFAAVVPGNWISRRMEAEADRASLILTGDPGTFIRAETRLARENLSDVLPPPWVEFTLYTHPSNVRRIRMAEEFR